MATTVPVVSNTQIVRAQRIRLLVAVMAWEARRFHASRLFWVQSLGFFCFLFFVIWVQGVSNQYSLPSASGFIAGTSAWGLLLTLPRILLLLVFLLPFVNAGGVTRDLQRRTHELFMTTMLPTWAYVWGRYLMGLLVSLGLALLLLAAILGMGLILHLTVTDYPAPEIGAVLLLWVGMVVPATILVSSLSFACGTLFPRLTTVVKIVILAGWFVGAEVLPTVIYFPSGPTGLPTWYINWDPTSALTALGMLSQYRPNFMNQASMPTSAAQFQQILLTAQNKMPDIGAWFPSHLLLAGLSLLLVVLAAFTFQRFRNAFNG